MNWYGFTKDIRMERMCEQISRMQKAANAEDCIPTEITLPRVKE
jgi:hypothetical protein